jgi:hypothetical protein
VNPSPQLGVVVCNWHSGSIEGRGHGGAVGEGGLGAPEQIQCMHDREGEFLAHAVPKHTLPRPAATRRLTSGSLVLELIAYVTARCGIGLAGDTARMCHRMRQWICAWPCPPPNCAYAHICATRTNVCITACRMRLTRTCVRTYAVCSTAHSPSPSSVVARSSEG